MNTEARNIVRAVKVPLYLVGSLWIVHILKLSLHLNLGIYGILPREISGIGGIFFAPFIHGSIEHLISNSVPLLILCFLILLVYPKIAFQSLLLLYILTGLAVWSFARGNVLHIGASGVVYAMVSFVFWTGLFKRNLKSIILALIVIFLYSGYFLGILPNQPGISWESHLFGGLVGIFVAFIMKDAIETEKPVSWEEETKVNYFPPDTFERTRIEREKDSSYSSGWTQDRT